MNHPFFKFFLLICLTVLTAGFQCNRCCDVVKPVYVFSEKFSLSPYKKSYAINDTIWLQFQTTDKKLFDKLTNTRVATDTTYLPLTFNYHKRYPTGGGAADTLCNIKVISGMNTHVQFLQAYNVLHLETDCSINSYFVKFGFIPKATGIYSIELFTAIVSNCQTRRSPFPLSTCSFIFDLPDCNKDIYLLIPEASRGGEKGYVDVRIDNKEIFVFKVE